MFPLTNLGFFRDRVVANAQLDVRKREFLLAVEETLPMLLSGLKEASFRVNRP